MAAVLIRQAGLIIAGLLSAAAIAQDTGSVEGRVTSSTAHTSIAGAVVKVASQRATSDASGAFRISGLTIGEHRFSFDAAGFLPYETKFRVAPEPDSARLDAELTPESSISGRVVDEERKPVAGVPIEITQAVRGTGTTSFRWGTTTDADGNYRQSFLWPGTYLLSAKPNSSPAPKAQDRDGRAWVRTYYPSTRSSEEAGKVTLQGGTNATAADIRLIAVPVRSIRGLVYDESGKRADATVRLLTIEWLESAHAQTQTRDGGFEFSNVPEGEWRVVAEAERGGKKLRGEEFAVLKGKDAEDLGVRLIAPFALEGSVEPSNVQVANVELFSRIGSAGAQPDSEGKLHFRTVYPGRYTVSVFTNSQDHYLASVLIGDEDVLGQEVLITPGTPPIRVVFKPNSAALRGTVENCGGGEVLLLPDDEDLWNYHFIRRASCDDAGRFEMRGLRPGGYYALAVERVSSTGLDDLSVLRRLASMAEKVKVDAGGWATVELKPWPWPE